MGHFGQLDEKPYRELLERLNYYPVGAPDTAEMFEILNILYTVEEAKVAARFPLGPATLAELSKRSGIAEQRLTEILEAMAQKGLVVDNAPGGEIRVFKLAPTLFGFFEMTFMRLDKALPRQRLATLLEDLRPAMGKEFFAPGTPMARTLVYENNIPPAVTSQVMPYEQASDVLRHSSHLALQTCFCRHKALHIGHTCHVPLDVCMAFGFAAEFVIRRGLARKVGIDEMLRVLDMTEELGLVHIMDNVREDPIFICNCSNCCCDFLKGITELKVEHAISPSRFLARIDPQRCNGCTVCMRKCQVNSINIIQETGNRKAVIDREQCLGCSICVSACKRGAIEMIPRPTLPHVPKNQFTRHLRVTREKGRLRHVFFYLSQLLLRGESFSRLRS